MKNLIFFLCSWHFSCIHRNQRSSNKNRKTLILAHRGLTARHLENTREAIEEAFLVGADGVEFDVQLTKDLMPVVTHDNSLKRLCGVDKNVSDLLWSEVRLIRQKIPNYSSSYAIPTLEEILAAIPAGKLANVELKESVQEKGQAGVDSIAGILSFYRKKVNIIISSFLPEILHSLKDSDFQLGYLIDEEKAFSSYIRGRKIIGRVQFLNPHVALVDKTTSRLLQKLGVDLIFWGHPKSGQEKYIIEDKHFGLITDIAEQLIVKK